MISATVLAGVSLWCSEIQGLLEDEVVPDVVEIQATDQGGNSVSKLSLRVTIAAGFWYLMGKEASERHERCGVLEDHCRTSSALACVVRLPPPHLLDGEVLRHILQFQLSWKLMPSCPLYFEPGKEGPPGWLDPSSCVSDPLWNPGKKASSYWKIHGWHEERWVRLYPKAALISLAPAATQNPPVMAT